MAANDIQARRARFLVELSPADTAYADIETLGDRCRRACAELAREGTIVRLLRSVFVPEDDRCLLIFEARGADAVTAVIGRANLGLERVIEAIALP